MIRVNLLPQEYRKAEATPLKQFFATVGAVVLAALAATVWAFIYFGSLEPMVKERDDLTQRIKDQKAGLDRVKKLDTRVKELKAQYSKIDEVAKNRVVWSRKLDELWEVVVNPKQPGRYEVWLKGLSCQTATGGPKVTVGGTVQFSGVSAGAQVSRLADYHEDLASSEFFKDFQKITPPLRHPRGARRREPGPEGGLDLQLHDDAEVPRGHGQGPQGRGGRGGEEVIRAKTVGTASEAPGAIEDPATRVPGVPGDRVNHATGGDLA